MTRDFSRQFKALAHKNRLAIFEYLREHELSCGCLPDEGCTVGDIGKQFELALSTVSHHLKVLYEAGLIVCEHRGQFSFCCTDREAIEQLRSFLGPEE